MKRHGGTKQAIRNALRRLGLQARPAEVVSVLAEWGVFVREALVRAVVFEMLRDDARAEGQRIKARTPPPPPPMRRFPRAPLPRGRRR